MKKLILPKQLINDKKFYIIDNGFIGVLSKKLTKDKGWLLENLVFNTLSKDNEIFYYSNRYECDFLLVKNKNVTAAIQVCYDLNDENKEREISGLMEAMEVFNLKEGLILTFEQEEIIQEKFKISVKPIWKWLLENES